MNTPEKREVTLEPTKQLSQKMVEKAFGIYQERLARREAMRAPHKAKVKKTRRAKSKVQRASRKGNR